MGERRLAIAKEQSEAARARLIDSLLTLRARLSPGAIVRDLKDSAVARGAEVARTGADAVIENKWTVAGAASLIGLFLARKPIAALLERGDETADPPARLDKKPATSAKEKK